MLEDGASAGELQALFGWATLRQVDLYTRKANRARLEDSTVGRLERENKNSIKGRWNSSTLACRGVRCDYSDEKPMKVRHTSQAWRPEAESNRCTRICSP